MEKVALVTGGASGIGFAIAKSLRDNGIQVAIADLNQEDGEAAAQQLNAEFFQCDLSVQENNLSLVKAVANHFGHIDILVNNAGFQYISPIESFPENTFNTMLSVMLTSPFLLTKYCWPYMKKNNWGRIINIASIHGKIASPYKSAYVTAKHGLMGLTKSSALEGGEFGITANTICPAYVKTPLVEKQIADQASNHNIDRDQVIKEIMLKKAAIKKMIEPEEIGAMVNYLISDAGRSITGTSLSIDLGWTAQ
ncbi:3-hydroxybutyrate dehydrogenase [Vibrio sp. SCSIO 43132]|uniref:3-hydroxybutyrate dehydrogenase n=1 Tax=Vibrio sp. SCSIO 43132 TaxID=2779363 RepID=UPI001CA9B5F6|nr:3-hydroxybutyrate dehydrogenase [Vibrio sp. SCSIO 43132]UAB69188.1 3-hydroxybutyrate dehydrogenase [Vibrio sp. SCSIO 43132]